MRRKNKRGKKNLKNTGIGTFAISIAAVGCIAFVMINAPFIKQITSQSQAPDNVAITLSNFSVTQDDISTLAQTLNTISDHITEETISCTSETEMESMSITNDIWGDGDVVAWPQNNFDIWAEGDGLTSSISASVEDQSHEN